MKLNRFDVVSDVPCLICMLAFIEGMPGVTKMTYLSAGSGEPTLSACLKSSFLATQPITPMHG